MKKRKNTTVIKPVGIVMVERGALDKKDFTHLRTQLDKAHILTYEIKKGGGVLQFDLTPPKHHDDPNAIGFDVDMTTEYDDDDED